MSLNNSQYDIIMRAYEQKQSRHRDILNKHYEEVYRRVPELKNVEDTLSSLGVAKAKALISGDESALSSFKEERRRLSARKQDLLTAAGFPADYLEPTYDCPDCQDTGYINNHKCSCFKRAEIALLYTQSNLKGILEKENFDTFSLDYYSPNYIDSKTGRSALDNMKQVLDTCHHFVDDFETEFQNILFYGEPGVGKTFLSNCIAKELMDRSYSVIYFTAAELFSVFEKHRFSYADSDEELYEHIFDCDLLIIDDLGTELPNSFTLSKLFVCINNRLLRKKSTIISTNLSLDDVKSIYSDRIFSRISSYYKTRKLIGDDIRIKKSFMNREDK